jgi:hypothetical protein
LHPQKAKCCRNCGTIKIAQIEDKIVKSGKIWDLIANNYDKGEKSFEPIHIQTIENTKKYLNRDNIVLVRVWDRNKSL